MITLDVACRSNKVRAGSFVVGPQDGLYQLIKVDNNHVVRLLLNDTVKSVSVPLPVICKEGAIEVTNVNQLTASELVEFFGPCLSRYNLLESYTELDEFVSYL